MLEQEWSVLWERFALALISVDSVLIHKALLYPVNTCTDRLNSITRIAACYIRVKRVSKCKGRL